MKDDYWQDRILVPTAIKGALPECSRKKIDEIEQENTALENIFNKLRQLEKDKKKNPFTRIETDLSPTEIKTLEDNGVIIRDADEYYMSEIFRWGLDFSQLAGRSKVLALARRARASS